MIIAGVAAGRAVVAAGGSVRRTAQGRTISWLAIVGCMPVLKFKQPRPHIDEL
jgi:hypothetical protein